MVQTNQGLGRQDLKCHKEQIPTAFQQAKEEKGEQIENLAGGADVVPKIERSIILNKKAASIGCKKCRVRKNQRE